MFDSFFNDNIRAFHFKLHFLIQKITLPPPLILQLLENQHLFGHLLKCYQNALFFASKQTFKITAEMKTVILTAKLYLSYTMLNATQTSVYHIFCLPCVLYLFKPTIFKLLCFCCPQNYFTQCLEKRLFALEERQRALALYRQNPMAPLSGTSAPQTPSDGPLDPSQAPLLPRHDPNFFQMVPLQGTL